MKTLLFKSIAILIVLSSCTAGKSFLHQRYTSYGHKKHHTETSAVASHKTAKPVTVAPVEAMPVVETVASSQAVASAPAAAPQVLTASVSKKLVRRLAAAPRLLKSAVSINEPYSLQKNNNSKTFNKQLNQQAKHGLLFGLIDAILAIVLSVIFVALIVLLVLVLI